MTCQRQPAAHQVFLVDELDYFGCVLVDGDDPWAHSQQLQQAQCSRLLHPRCRITARGGEGRWVTVTAPIDVEGQQLSTVQ